MTNTAFVRNDLQNTQNTTNSVGGAMVPSNFVDYSSTDENSSLLIGDQELYGSMKE